MGLHKNGILLPRPQLSKPVSVGTNRELRSKTGNTVSGMQRLWSHPRLSDSDGEEGVSEADRDARLA